MVHGLHFRLVVAWLLSLPRRRLSEVVLISGITFEIFAI
jgi:hypothetical protein